MRTVLSIVLGLLWAASLSAQDNKPADHAAPTASKRPVVATLTRQASAMKKLAAAMEGTWKATVHMEASAWSPKAMVSNGSMVAKMGPGGLSLVQDFRSKGEMGPYAGLGVLWYDSQASAYKGLWCDTMSPDGCGDGGTGNWDGDKIVVTLDTMQSGKKSHLVTTYSFGPGTMTEEFQNSEDGGPLKRIMLIEYKRVSGTAPQKPTGKG